MSKEREYGIMPNNTIKIPLGCIPMYRKYAVNMWLKTLVQCGANFTDLGGRHYLLSSCKIDRGVMVGIIMENPYCISEDDSGKLYYAIERRPLGISDDEMVQRWRGAICLGIRILRDSIRICRDYPK